MIQSQGDRSKCGGDVPLHPEDQEGVAAEVAEESTSYRYLQQYGGSQTLEDSEEQLTDAEDRP